MSSYLHLEPITFLLGPEKGEAKYENNNLVPPFFNQTKK